MNENNQNPREHNHNAQKFCIIDLPYPETEGVGRDIRLAGLLSAPYTGIWGELSVISDYIYQNIIFEEHEPEAAEILECIAMAEMRHFKLIGELIFDLGGDPVIKTNIKTGTLNMDTHSDRGVIKRVLEANIRAEKYAVRNYSEIITQTHDPAVIGLLERIIMDEEYHIKLFSELLQLD